MAGQGILGTLAKIVLGAIEVATRRKDSGSRSSRESGASGSRDGRPAGAGSRGTSSQDRAQSRREPAERPTTRPTTVDGSTRSPASASVTTVEVRPEDVEDLRLEYAPSQDGDPDAGEIVWTWVPYVENDGRGKDRPVLIIARHGAERFYAVKLTSKSHDGDREYVSIGSGSWDSAGRESWVDLDQLYSVHVDGMRREAAALDLDRFTRIAAVLQRQYGWDAGR